MHTTVWTRTEVGILPDGIPALTTYGFSPLTDVPNGQSLKRTRLQISLKNVVTQTTTGVMPWSPDFYTSQNIQIGLTLLDTGEPDPTPEHLDDNAEGGYWIFNDMLIPSVDIITDATGKFIQIISWDAPGDGTIESFTQRKAATDGEARLIFAWRYVDTEGFFQGEYDGYGCGLFGIGWMSNLFNIAA